MNRQPTPFRGRIRILAIALLAAAAIGAPLAIAIWRSRTALMDAVRNHVDPAIDETRPLGAVFRDHPHLKTQSWSGNWSNVEDLVAVDLRVERYAEIKRSFPGLVAGLVKHVAMNRSWVAIDEEQPACLQIVFQGKADADGKLTVRAITIRMTEVWVEYQPAAVGDYESAIEKAISSADDPGQARLYRLRHDGDKALFNAGLDGFVLAGAGQANDPGTACVAIARWR